MTAHVPSSRKMSEDVIHQSEEKHEKDAGY